jgi:hypothetical protein
MTSTNGRRITTHEATIKTAAVATHLCDNPLPLVVVDAAGQQLCIDCVRAQAWRDGYVEGVADGKEFPTCPACDGYIPGSGVAV